MPYGNGIIGMLYPPACYAARLWIRFSAAVMWLLAIIAVSSPAVWASQEPVIDRIKITTQRGKLPSEVRGATNFLYGRTFSSETSGQLIASVQKILTSQGYQAAKVRVTPQIRGNKVTLRVAISLGTVCRIQSVKASFALPKGLPNPVGKPCSRRTKSKYFSALGTSYKKNNYIENTFEKATYQFATKGASADIIIVGKPGPQIFYEFALTGHPQPKKLKKIVGKLRRDIQPALVNPNFVAEKAGEILLKAGYYSTFAQPTVSRNNQRKTFRYELKVSEQIQLEYVRVLGVKAISQQQLTKLFTPKNLLGIKKRLAIHRLPDTIQILLSQYQQKGYFDVKIRKPEITKIPGSNRHFATITVSEGLPYIFHELHFTNPSSSDEYLKATFELQKGDPLDESLIKEFSQKISMFYGNMGYLNNEVEISLSKKLRKNRFLTKIHVKVQRGERYTVKSISISGLNKTRREVVERQLQIAPQDTYSPEKMDLTYDRLKNLGLFKSIRFENSDLGGDQNKDLAISVQLEELDHGLITFGPEYNLLTGYQYSVGASYNNLFGKGHKIFARVRIDEDRNQQIFDTKTIFASHLSLRYIYPYIAGLPVDFSLYGSRRVSAPSFWRYSSLLRQELSYHLPTKYKTKAVAYTKQSSSREVGTQDQRTYFLANQDSLIFASGLELIVDRRNNTFRPTSGNFTKITYEKAFYAALFNTKYDRWSLTTEFVKSFTPKTAVLLDLRFTKFWNIDVREVPAGFNTLPAAELLQAGGPDYVKGFDRLLGPYLMYSSEGQASTVQDILGGTDRLVANLKLRMLMNHQLATNLFYDLGNTFLSSPTIQTYQERFDQVVERDQKKPAIYDNYPLDREDYVRPIQLWKKLYSSAGISFDYLTPIGNISLSLSHPLYQPSRPSCRVAEGESTCLDRRKASHPIWKRTKLDLTIAAQF